MGIVNSADIDNTAGKVTIIANKNRCDCYDRTIVNNDNNDISTQYLNVNNVLHERSYIGEISSKHVVSLHFSVCETQKITMTIVYKLTNYSEDNTQIKKVHGQGHIVFRNNKHCTSVQLCIESLNISSDGDAVATYVGYLEKNFHFLYDDCYNCCVPLETNVDTCVTFMLTFSAPPT